MSLLQGVLITLVRLYRWGVSPLKTFVFGPAGRCRFTPSCSQYALEALQQHGGLRGAWLAVKRLARCHPWGGCGHDPVPVAVVDHAKRKDHSRCCHQTVLIEPGTRFRPSVFR